MNKLMHKAKGLWRGLFMIMAAMAMLHGANVAEVSSELHPDRYQQPTGFYDGRLETVPGLQLPR